MILLLALAHGATLNVPLDYATIDAAVDASSDGDEIVIAGGNYCEHLHVYTDITIRGEGVAGTSVVLEGACQSGSIMEAYGNVTLIDLTFDGGATTRGLVVEASAEVDGQDLTFINGYQSTGYGGGVLVDPNSVFECTGCRFEGNSAAKGGAVRNEGLLVLDDSVICGNTATEDGGAVFSKGTTILRRTAIVRNHTDDDAALYVTGRGGHQVHNSVFLENTTLTGTSSAIQVVDALDLRNSIFSGHSGAVAVDNTGEANTGGYNLYSGNLDGDVTVPYATDLLGADLAFVDPGVGCVFDLTLDAAADNDGIGAGDPDLVDPAGTLPQDIGLDGGTTVIDDADGDHFDAAIDCDPDDADTYPGAEELCDGIDNDCFEGVPSDELDADGDGFSVCEGDCNDGDAFVAPGIEIIELDVADGIDRDCDGFDECYVDADDDGYGTDQAFTPATIDGICDAFASAIPGDCNEDDSGQHPGAQEVCSGIDDDCDGYTDEADPDTVVPVWFLDSDGDLFGDADSSLAACFPDDDYVADASDCDDSEDAVNPDAVELCDAIDNDCDQLFDDEDPDVTGQSTWYPDTDGDGFGDPDEAPEIACGRPVGYVANGEDCNDALTTTFPGAVEQCDGLDNDCDTEIDEDVEFTEWWPDADGDGTGDPDGTAVTDCIAPPGHVNNALDCDDTSNTVSPAFPEWPCDGIDNDCNPATLDDDGSCDTGTITDTGTPPADADTDADADSDTDTDSDADTDADADADADTDADTDTDTQTDVPGTTASKAPAPVAPDYGCGCANPGIEVERGWLAALVRRRAGGSSTW